MVAPSKIFEWPLNRLHCAHFMHSLPYQSCTQAFVWNLYRNHVSSAQYYLPFLLVPLLFKWRQMNQKKLLAILKHYALTTSFASCINALTFYFMCMGRRFNGRFVCSFTPYLSCWLASQLSWWMPPSVLQLYGTGIMQSALEGALRQWNVKLVHSRTAQTLLFMLCSMAVLQAREARHYAGFWFIKPTALPEDYDEISMVARIKKGLKEMRAYLGVGLALDLVGIVKSRKLTLQFKSTSFMLTYMGIYKLTQCLLAGRLPLRQLNCLAAFLGGSAYLVLSRLTILTFSIVVAVQALFQQLLALDSRYSKRFAGPLAFLRSTPWAQLLIPLNLPYLVHSFYFNRHVINRLAINFINSTCDGNAQRMYNMLMLSDIDTILKTVNNLPITPFF